MYSSHFLLVSLENATVLQVLSCPGSFSPHKGWGESGKYAVRPWAEPDAQRLAMLVEADELAANDLFIPAALQPCMQAEQVPAATSALCIGGTWSNASALASQILQALTHCTSRCAEDDG